MHDVVIRGGTIVDGTGAPAFTGDVALDGDRIAQVGGKAGPAKRPRGAWSSSRISASRPCAVAPQASRCPACAAAARSAGSAGAAPPNQASKTR